MATDAWAGAGAVITTGGAEAVVIITGGPGAAATAAGKLSLDSLIAIHCPGDRRMTATRTGRANAARPVQPPEYRWVRYRWRSAEPHLDRDPDQVRMILGAELLLQQRGGVGHRLVGNLQRIGDFDDLVAAAKQPQDFQLARRHLRRRIGLDRSP